MPRKLFIESNGNTFSPPSLNSDLARAFYLGNGFSILHPYPQFAITMTFLPTSLFIEGLDRDVLFLHFSSLQLLNHWPLLYVVFQGLKELLNVQKVSLYAYDLLLFISKPSESVPHNKAIRMFRKDFWLQTQL